MKSVEDKEQLAKQLAEAVRVRSEAWIAKDLAGKNLAKALEEKEQQGKKIDETEHRLCNAEKVNEDLAKRVEELGQQLRGEKEREKENLCQALQKVKEDLTKALEEKELLAKQLGRQASIHCLVNPGLFLQRP